MQSIDDETLQAIMKYFHLEDDDQFLGYASAARINLLPKKDVNTQVMKDSNTA